MLTSHHIMFVVFEQFVFFLAPFVFFATVSLSNQQFCIRFICTFANFRCKYVEYSGICQREHIRKVIA